MTLYAPDESSMTLAQSALARDPHVTLLAFDPTVIEKQKTDCGSASCQAAVNAACSWSALQGAEYYALASSYSSYHSDYKCTRYDSDLFDKHDKCVEGHETNQATLATYTLDVYDVKTCSKVIPLSKKITARSGGPEEQSKPDALAKLTQRVPLDSEGIPDQVTIEPDGRLAGETRDGFYALYRGGHYRGYVKLSAAGTSSQALQPMYFPLSPSPGDALVARGRRKFVDLALDAVIGTLSYGGERKLAGGMGAHVRHYKLDGGLQYGFGADYVASVATKSNVFLFTPELGWGVPIAPGIVLSANLGVGFARANQVDMSDELHTAYAGHAIATARVQTFLATWFYVTGDVGYVLSGTFDDWDGTGPSATEMSMRSPIVRIYAGFDL